MTTLLPKPMVPKNVKGITTYVKPEVYAYLKELAEEEDRTISNLVARILAAWVEEKKQ